jgi:predicted permease
MRAMEPIPAPPKVARELLVILLGSEAADEARNTLDELFRVRTTRDGLGKARRWYWRQVLIFALPWNALGLRRRASGRHGESRLSITSWTWLESCWQDVRVGLRALWRRPAFSLMTLCTLALGLGTTTTLFSLVNTTLIQPLPYSQPGEPITIWQSRPGYRGQPGRDEGWDRSGLSYLEFVDLRDHTELLAEVGIHLRRSAILNDQGEAQLIQVGVVSSSLFPMLGAQPELGRFFLPGEDTPSAGPHLAVLSHELWQSRFGSDPDILGKSIELSGTQHHIIGVMPKGFRLRRPSSEGGSDTGARAVWVSLAFPGTPSNRGAHAFEGLGRVREGVAVQQARDEVRSLLPDDSGHPAPLVPLVESRAEVEARPMREPLLLFFAATGVLFLIAWGNVSLLVSGEALLRRQEIATRSALGARRGRIARQLLTESLLLGVGGAALGCFFAAAGTQVLLSLLPPIPRGEEVGMAPLVLGFSAGLGILTALGFGLVPVALTRPRALGFALRGRGGGRTLGGRRTSGALVAGQLALTTVLLVGSGLLLRSLGALVAVDPGFDHQRLAAARIVLTTDRYADPAQRLDAIQRIVENLRSLPGVATASAADRLPFFDGIYDTSFSIVGRVQDPDESAPIARRGGVLPGFYQAMGVPLLDGRDFQTTDVADATPVMIINEELARVYWPDSSPLGERVSWRTVEWTVVGIVGSTQVSGLDEENVPEFAVPLHQAPPVSVSLVARTEGDPEALIPLFRLAVSSVDAGIPLYKADVLENAVSRTLERRSSASALMVLFAISAATLALVGLFGMTVRRVTHRRLELAVRVALGADPLAVRLMVLREAGSTALLGILLGLVLAGGASVHLTGFLFRIGARDPSVFLATSFGLAAFAALVSWIPARKATRIAPISVLREE